jgi:predicted nucleic acid-binding Zn ribbon protein
MKKCQFCAEDIQDDAKVCKHCKKEQKKAFSKKMKIVAGLLWLFVFIMIVSGINSCSNDLVVDNSGADDGKAHIIAQSYVKNVLKSPSTADFPTFDYTAYDLENNKYKIISYVDSQNSFGAEVRSNYSVILSYNNSDWADINNWTLHELIFDGEIMYQEPVITE